MALVKLRDFVAGDGTFIGVVSTFETALYRRVLITADDGTCQGYERIADGRLYCGPLVTRNAAKVTVDAASATAAAADATKNAAASAAVLAEVARIRVIAAASRTSTEKAFLGMAWLLLRQE